MLKAGGPVAVLVAAAVAVAAVAACRVGAGGGGFISSLLCNDYDNTSCVKSTFGSFMSSTQALCEVSKDNKPNTFITPQPRETLIRKRVSVV